METYIITLCGLYAFGFAIFHLFFWKLLHWKTELEKLSYINRGVMQIMNIQLIVYFLTIGFLCLYFNATMIENQIGRFLLIATSIFCLIRLIQQFVFFRNINTWQIHLLSLLFLFGTLIFYLPLCL